MADITTIIFGATGGVGSATARAAHQQGAKVVLALRDPRKQISGFTPEQERAAGIERVRADFSDPETVARAVRETRAKRAFIYALLGQTPDFLRTSITALKDAGVEFVVLLSSAGVQGDIRSVPATQFVPFAHAQVEISLDEVFGPGAYVAVRPGYFASNALWWKGMVRDGEVKTIYPEATADWITPGDIGRVCGSLLVAGPEAIAMENAVELYGPELVSFKEAVQIIGSAVGKEIQVTQLDEEAGVQWYTKELGMPAPMARDLVDVFKANAERSDREDGYYSGSAYSEAVANVQKYGGRRPRTFKEWVEENKHEFNA
ncbi:hypothetical protein EDB81DRAFT_632526 [Dactylonectria macrodidyma]|uniref:NAD(P)-binding domain-containing protein n=1 Tax=Dactylonectria macrodidyma TaxID=307937 RepID=A0A9P9FSW7_9HYPO|nr:hypothetical protein EDB81DRAFT_632526 [Dactylonectria macrodidyma]